ncbi:hypothetical protein ILUMI_16185 [Ignelater luminosus]|uniref:Reverse transcriptase domain-containing protein n=1 Tax=Ignelater luminosus TaxID=2038154 RepID=A0A8K0CM86_IGNLU|nr:hypothetical protein ILUMI_16185 [Ignelater luminosus]
MDKISINRGVKQGDLLSPYLSHLLMDELLIIFQNPDAGLKIGENSDAKVSVLAYTDDLCSFKKDNYFELETRLKKTEDLWDKFDDLQLQIEIISQKQKQVQYRSIFENQYLAVVNQVIGERSKPPTSKPRLPSIDLPQFGGAYEQWFSFVGNFEALVNRNGNFAKVHKFYYFQRCLKGEARQVIEALDVTAANYSTAWDLLRERFENKRLIVDKHIQGILSLPTIKQESAILLRTFLDTI